MNISYVSLFGQVLILGLMILLRREEWKKYRAMNHRMDAIESRMKTIEDTALSRALGIYQSLDRMWGVVRGSVPVVCSDHPDTGGGGTVAGEDDGGRTAPHQPDGDALQLEALPDTDG